MAHRAEQPKWHRGSQNGDMAMPRLHPRTIDAVKERADIVDVVGEHVVLKKKGREFVGVCPFHDDSKPSMTVSPQKQFYYCFSCGAGGNSIKFLMEFQRQSFSDVVLDLARRYQLPVETVDGPQQERLRQQLSRRDHLHRALALASGWFRSQLKSASGADALAYLRDQRGLSEATMETFELGYAPDQWDGLLKHLQHVEGLSPELLESAGLVVPRKGGNGFYDRFRGRVIVPIRDRQGRVIGFGGRSLDGSDPKYLNSPETEVFEKGKHLFGLDQAANAIRKDDRAVVVEGYFDVIALHAAGITNSVASLGTALSSQQITQLCRCSDGKRIVLNFDADRAGIRAANRAIGEVEQLALQGQLELRVLHTPSGKDPDEYLKDHGAGDYRALLDQAPLWLDWQIEQVLEDRDLTKADQFQQAVSGLVELLGKLPQSAIRTHYLQQVAERLSGGKAVWRCSWSRTCANRCKVSAGMDVQPGMKRLVKSASESVVKPRSCVFTCIVRFIAPRCVANYANGSWKTLPFSTTVCCGLQLPTLRKATSAPVGWRQSVGGRILVMSCPTLIYPVCSPISCCWKTVPWLPG